jgi:DNA-binding NtrC family response regulator
MQAIESYDWPGSVRELESNIKPTFIQADSKQGRIIIVGNLPILV